jgi:acyl dehydratase
MPDDGRRTDGADSPGGASAGAITDQAIENLRGWLGVERRERGWNAVVTEDAIWHFALGVGDDNPLWWDRAHAESSRWGRMFAPPTFLYTCGNAGLRVGEEGIYPAQDFMPGTLPLWVSDRWVFQRPAFEGEAVTAISDLVSVEERPTRDGARSLNYTDRVTYTGADGSVIGQRYQLMLRRERPAGGAAPPAEVPETRYGDEDRRRIGAEYDREPAQRRGARTLHGNEIRPGDAIPTLVKGPLTVTNIVGWMLGWGSPLCPTNRIAHQYLTEHPLAGLEDPRRNIQDTIEGVHWDPYLAQTSGMARCYDFGAQRVSWIAHLLTDWIGDEGILTELEVRVRRPNFVGDTTWISGEVTARREDGDSVAAAVALSAVNQRGEQTVTGTAQVRVPR